MKLNVRKFVMKRWTKGELLTFVGQKIRAQIFVTICVIEYGFYENKNKTLKPLEMYVNTYIDK